ncbi:flagellar biosynthesis anti-sigma factor FlgM [Tepidibacillus fermentans]|uniref:Negative regulator of flagellin synthesis n=1 Tax=Tepidibacillus fermentans TaxID=1281767 RepID=A0A4R3KKP8_9BACI|nr:flagellar biosynthesis anti-sigma factor FlgM [Tepidibacillus fermentans]TCS83323.1 FlgM family anti-sigma-28 factor [Tepidibacillus fermentans]
MRINDINRIQGINQYQKMNQKKEEIKKTEQKKDQILISEEAKELLEKSKDLTRREKIDQIKEQIQNGTYMIDPKKVADKILDWLK